MDDLLAVLGMAAYQAHQDLLNDKKPTDIPSAPASEKPKSPSCASAFDAVSPEAKPTGHNPRSTMTPRSESY